MAVPVSSDLVLVVDDDESVRSSFAGVLRAAGFEVIEAADGFIALETLRATRVAAVVLDLRMPVLDGFTLLDRLDDPPPIILATVRGYDGEITRRRDKVFRYLQKPVPPETLITMVAEAVTASRPKDRHEATPMATGSQGDAEHSIRERSTSMRGSGSWDGSMVCACGWMGEVNSHKSEASALMGLTELWASHFVGL